MIFMRTHHLKKPIDCYIHDLYMYRLHYAWLSQQLSRSLRHNIYCNYYNIILLSLYM